MKLSVPKKRFVKHNYMDPNFCKSRITINLNLIRTQTIIGRKNLSDKHQQSSDLSKRVVFSVVPDIRR